MKVALMLTGLARKVEEGYEHYWKHIIDNHDVDFYLHCWKDEEWEKDCWITCIAINPGAKNIINGTPSTSPLSAPIANDKTNKNKRDETKGEKIV